jgi:hypothetical protein
MKVQIYDFYILARDQVEFLTCQVAVEVSATRGTTALVY